MNPTRRKLLSLTPAVLALSLLFAFAGHAGAASEQARPIPPGGLRVLFLGNSLTQANDLPLMVQALAKSAGQDLEVETIAFPNANLEDLWFEGSALAAIDQGNWDFVVMQQGPSSLPESRVHLRKWVGKFAKRIRAAGARPAVYMVWPSIDRIAFFDAVSEAYTLAATDVRGLLIPGGEVWRAAWRRNPDLELYGPDGFHPTIEGTYAVALSMYGMFYLRSTKGLPARLELDNGEVIHVRRPVARLLQDAADEANRTFGRP